MDAELDFLDHLELESARFAEAIHAAPPTAQVPSCPDWDADDLLWHLAEVQWFWGTIVRERITDPPGEDLTPVRPAGRDALAAFYDRVSRDLADVLAATPPDTPAWTWWPENQTVGFIRRRQAHEALIHRVDAELTAGQRTPMDPALSADGVDEALRVMYGGAPPWAAFTPTGTGALRLRASDTGDTWLITVGRFTGTSPSDGKRYDEPTLQVAQADPGDPAAAEIQAAAADLDCWLWHRPTFRAVTPSGTPAALAAFTSAIAEGIN
jgi:uncharacterized protein (TIGR03083 family)